MKKTLLLVLACIMIFLMASCTVKTEKYEDEEGNVKEFTYVTKETSDKFLLFEEALTEKKLVEGEEGPYGMYIKKVTAITADYDVDQSFWSLSQNGTPLSTGASGAEIKGGEHFEFIHTK